MDCQNNQNKILYRVGTKLHNALVITKENQSQYTHHSNMTYEELKKTYKINFDLSYADLSEIDLSHKNLDDINLTNANLFKANLSYSFLRNANFTEANLKDANLSYAKLSKTNFKNANLENANLSHVVFCDGIFQETNLYGCKFDDAIFEGCNFQSSDLRAIKFKKICSFKNNLLLGAILDHPITSLSAKLQVYLKKYRLMIDNNGKVIEKQNYKFFDFASCCSLQEFIKKK